MKALIQRVSHAAVHVNEECRGQIGPGILLLLAVEPNDTPETVGRLLHKVIHYRIFADATGRMNQSLLDCGGELLVVSQFTLAADTRKGMRPGFSTAAPPALAEALYNAFVAQAEVALGRVATGEFGADMAVSLVNDGPVTFLLDVN